MINKYTLDNTNFNLGHLWKREVHNGNMTNSWTNYNAWGAQEWGQAGYWVDAFGIIHFSGMVTGGSASTNIFTAGTPWAPSYRALSLAVSASALARVDLDYNSSVYCGLYTSTWLSLANLHVCLWVDGWQYPTFTNSWVNYDTTYTLASYIKDPLSWIHIRGLVKSGTSGTSVFTLPSGYRPSRALRVPSIANAAYGYIDIGTDGTVVATGNNAWFSLTGDFVFTLAESESDNSWIDIPAAWFSNNWTHYDSNVPAQYIVDTHGMVHYRGSIKRSTGSITSAETIISIDSNLSPSKSQIIPVDANSAFGAIQVHAGSNTISVSGTAASVTKTSLDGIRYKRNMFS